MKAWVLHDVGNIQYEDVVKPQLSETEVLVSVKAVGICGSDIPRIYRDGAHKMPLIPGHEFSGTVVMTGAAEDADWIGKRVGVFPLIPCGKCAACQKMQYELCRHYSYLGSRCNGGFAEYVAVPVCNLIELPDEVSFEEAAMLEPMAVGVHAMRRAGVTSMETVAVCGMGTIGLLLCMFLMEAGVKRILAIGNKDFQKEQALRNDITEADFCDIRTMDVDSWIQEKTNGQGVDVFFECVGKNETFLQAIRNTAPAGQVVLVGNPYSNMTLDKVTYWKILRNQLTITGTWNTSFTHEETDDWNYVLERLRARSVRPTDFITHRLAMKDLVKGLRLMRDKSEDYVKVMGILG